MHHSYQLKTFSQAISVLEALCHWGSHHDAACVPKLFEKAILLLLIYDSSLQSFVTEALKSPLLPLSLVEDRMVPIQNQIKLHTSGPLSSLDTRRIFIVVKFLLTLWTNYTTLVPTKLMLFFLGQLYICRRLPPSFMLIDDFCLGRHLIYFSKKFLDRKAQSIQPSSLFSSWGLSTISSYLALSAQVISPLASPASTPSTVFQDSLLMEGMSSIQNNIVDLAMIKKKLPDLYPGAATSFIEESFGSYVDFASFFAKLSPSSINDESFLSFVREVVSFISLLLCGEQHFNMDVTSFTKNDTRVYIYMKELVSFYCELLFHVLHINVSRMHVIWYTVSGLSCLGTSFLPFCNRSYAPLQTRSRRPHCHHLRYPHRQAPASARSVLSFHRSALFVAN